MLSAIARIEARIEAQIDYNFDGRVKPNAEMEAAAQVQRPHTVS